MIRVEELVDTHLPTLRARNPRLSRPLVAALKRLFHEKEFLQFEAQYPHLSGFDFIDQALTHFDFRIRVDQHERERIPVSGRVVIVANHPIGSLDGLALLKLVGDIRRDVKVMANDMLMAIEPLQPLLLAVDNLNERTPKENLRAIYEHLDADGALIVFPAGEVSRLRPQGVRDGHWHGGFLRLARKTRAPILPIFVDARNSAVFYSLSMLAKPLSTLWLVREMFKHSDNQIGLRIGKPIAFRQYQDLAVNTKTTVKLFRKHVYRLAKGRELFQFSSPLVAVAHPENRQALRSELRDCPTLGHTSDGKRICLYRYRNDSAVMREIGRLRELAFRAVGEGTGGRRDIDRFDAEYEHIVLWDDEALEIAGAYRLRQTAGVRPEQLYSHSLFRFEAGFEPQLIQGLELGRSFVQPAYWGRRSLDYLWQGIGAYLLRHPQIRYLFGPVSISNHYPQAARDQIVRFYRQWFGSATAAVQARNPYRPDPCNFQPFAGLDYAEDFRQLRQTLASMGCTVPTLYKQYTELCETGGVQFFDFHLDADFADCVDGFVCVDLQQVKPARRQRYLTPDTSGSSPAV